MGAKAIKLGSWDNIRFVKLFRTPVARQVSRKVEPFFTSATARNGRGGEKTRVSPCNTTL